LVLLRDNIEGKGRRSLKVKTRDYRRGEESEKEERGNGRGPREKREKISSIEEIATTAKHVVDPSDLGGGEEG